MNNKIALGQYVDKNSIIHKLDPRNKLISLIVLMVLVFLIPSPLKTEKPYVPFIALGIIAFLTLIIVLLTKISLLKFLKSIKQMFFLFTLTFVLQMITPSTDGITVLDKQLYISVINLIIVIVLFLLFIFFRKYIPIKMIVFLGLLVLSVYLFTYQLGPTIATPRLKIYKTGLYSGAFFVLRVFIVLILSTILTLTTKPTDLTSALEWILHPLTYIKINVSVFAMLISLALRFIPTLFNESQKILKAQASRGVDFKEGNLKSQLMQVVSLLIPMFVISYKRAIDLADAMEARGYVPGQKRTKLNIMKFSWADLISFILVLLLMAFVIWWRIR